MREPLVIAVAQPPCVSYDVAANAVTHAATVRAAGARLVVFPERLQAEPAGKDELNEGRFKAVLSFELPRGAYGTLVVKRLFRG